MSDLELGVADHALAQHVQEHIGGGASPAAARVGRLHIGVEEVLVGEGVELKEVELPLQICYVSAHWSSCHAPPVQPAWRLCIFGMSSPRALNPGPVDIGVTRPCLYKAGCGRLGHVSQ